MVELSVQHIRSTETWKLLQTGPFAQAAGVGLTERPVESSVSTTGGPPARSVFCRCFRIRGV